MFETKQSIFDWAFYKTPEGRTILVDIEAHYFESDEYLVRDRLSGQTITVPRVELSFVSTNRCKQILDDIMNDVGITVDLVSVKITERLDKTYAEKLAEKDPLGISEWILAEAEFYRDESVWQLRKFADWLEKIRFNFL